jgi:hypothetical protein
MKPSTPKTELPPSAQLRKVVFVGGSLMKHYTAHSIRRAWSFAPAVVLTLILSWGATALAQWGVILTQNREGSATLYLSQNNGVAYILDGGAIGGLTKPVLDGKPVLQGLLDKGYRHLVISCSHPHEDHAGGIKEIIQTDPNLEKFESVRFVDSGYPTSDSLFTLFSDCHPQYDKTRVIHSSALDRDAFSAISGKDDGVYVSNFIYTPRPGAAPHGHSVIAHIHLQKGGKVVRIVDFDDANDELVLRWSAWALQDPANRKPDVVIAPHHGSDGNDISPLLNPVIRPSSCVITANKKNRYLHPGPANLRKWIEAVGKENVHITGALENVYIAETGLRPISPEAFRLTADEIIQPQIDRIAKELSDLESAAKLTSLSSSKQQTINSLKEEQVALGAVKQLYVEQKKSDPVVVDASRPNPNNGIEGTPKGPKRPPDVGSSGGPSKPSPILPRPAYGSVCELCGRRAVGRCSIRKIYVCDTHRYFTRNGVSYRCPR